MEKSKMENAMRFYLLATKLKYKIRSGWDKTHWNVTSKRLESVAEHSFGTCILAIALDSEFEYDIDLNKVIKMLVLHELGEVIIGDITPFDNVTLKEKEEIGKKAVADIVSCLEKKENYINLTNEFNARETKEAMFAHICI